MNHIGFVALSWIVFGSGTKVDLFVALGLYVVSMWALHRLGHRKMARLEARAAELVEANRLQPESRSTEPRS